MGAVQLRLAVSLSILRVMDSIHEYDIESLFLDCFYSLSSNVLDGKSLSFNKVLNCVLNKSFNSLSV